MEDWKEELDIGRESLMGWVAGFQKWILARGSVVICPEHRLLGANERQSLQHLHVLSLVWPHWLRVWQSATMHLLYVT